MKMKRIFILLLTLTGTIFISYAQNTKINKEDVIIENDQIKLIITKEGTAKSLMFKPTNEECLIEGKKVPICAITQDRPYQNEIKLAYPTKETTFKSNSVRREGDKLIVGFVAENLDRWLA